jgi:hypothetical protein
MHGLVRLVSHTSPACSPQTLPQPFSSEVGSLARIEAGSLASTDAGSFISTETGSLASAVAGKVDRR